MWTTILDRHTGKSQHLYHKDGRYEEIRVDGNFCIVKPYAKLANHNFSYRIYFVDHNTRSTTWQRPNSERLMHFAHWQNQRTHIVSQGE